MITVTLLSLILPCSIPLHGVRASAPTLPVGTFSLAPSLTIGSNGDALVALEAGKGDNRNRVQAQKPAPKPHPEVQKLIDAATDDKLEWKDMPALQEKALAKAKELKEVCGEATTLHWFCRA